MTGPPGDRPGSPVYVVTGPGPEDEVDLRYYLRVLSSRRWFIGGFVGVCTVLAAVVTLFLPPVYRATAVIAPVKQEGGGGMSELASQFGGLASLAGVSVGGPDVTQERIAILTSRSFSTRLVEENDLLPQLFPDRWDSQQGRWNVPPEEVPTYWDAYRKFETIRQVDEDRKTGLVTVAIEWGDPEVAARWATLHVDTLNRHLQAEAVREAQDSITYLMDQVSRTSDVELRQTLFRLVEAQTKKAMLARVRDDFAFKVIDPAVPPDRRDRPRRKVIVAAAFVVSALLAVLVAFVLEFLRRLREQPEAPAAPVEPVSRP